MHEFVATERTYKIDSTIIIESSFELFNLTNQSKIANDQYELDFLQSTIQLHPTLIGDSLRATYRVLAPSLTDVVKNKDISNIEDDRVTILNPFPYIPPDEQQLVDFGTMNYNGSFSRGISFGNNQDVVFNSSLNLQLAGNLGDGIDVLAAISDDNIPIQPEGNTQQIQDFDKIYIEFKKEANSLLIGDFELKEPESYFMKFYKKLQGGHLTLNNQLERERQADGQLGLAISKGKFTRNTFNGQEGNQGPYKLVGPNGEQFIIILSGTERVFINDQLLTRGSAHDYTINYNSGEITFTTNRLITRDQRIVIEFEFSDRNYFRSLAYGNAEWSSKKLKARLNLYSEQDNKNQSVDQDLTSIQKQLLAGIGDNLEDAIIPNVEIVEFDINRIQYRLVDSLGIDSVYVFSTNPMEAIYNVSFTFVGQGNGDYRVQNGNANGRVFEWVQPIANQPQGSYIPARVIVPPEQQQLATFALDYQVNPALNSGFEIALSNKDLNTFSPINNSDNVGIGFSAFFKQAINFNQDPKNKTRLFLNGNYEFAGKHFNEIERYRNAEFARDWNSQLSTQSIQDEHLGQIELVLNDSKSGLASYQFSTYIIQSAQDAFRHRILVNGERRGFRALVNASVTTSENQELQSDFLRPKIDLSKRFENLNNWRLGIKGELEENRVNLLAADTLINQSFKYEEAGFYIENADSASNNVRLEYFKRNDYNPVGDQFLKSLESDKIERISCEFAF